MIVAVLVACGGTSSGVDRVTAACDGVLQEEEGSLVDGPFDKDGDGYVDGNNPQCRENYGFNALDCDDSIDEMHPDAVEVECNGLDDDCNSDTEDARDADGDGSLACEDCDDANPLQSPLAVDECWDDIDNDCDGIVDPDCGPNYTGTFDIDPPVLHTCRLFGLPFVDIDFSQIQVLWNPPYANLSSVGSAQPGGLDGLIEADGSFEVEGSTVIGTFASCDEYYRMTGTFTDADHFTLTFAAYYTGGGCGGCGGYFEFPDIVGVRTSD